MYAFHYWKCFYKEGPVFQTAKIFSIEVDYYNYGTCEVQDGAYFCGDHSCQTPGNLNAAGAGGKYVKMHEQKQDLKHNNVDWLRVHTANTAHGGGTHNGYDAQGNLLRPDAYGGQYHLYGNRKLQFAATAEEFSKTSPGGGNLTKYNWDAYISTLAPGDCETKCNEDDNCQAYAEFNVPHYAYRCLNYLSSQHFIDAARFYYCSSQTPKGLEVQDCVGSKGLDGFMSNHTSVSNGWNTYVKYAVGRKAHTWGRVPVTVSNAAGSQVSSSRGPLKGFY